MPSAIQDVRDMTDKDNNLSQKKIISLMLVIYKGRLFS